MSSVVTARDFRQNMKQYLDSASIGNDVIITRGNEHFMVVKVEVNITPEITPELRARLDAAHAEYERGEYTRFKTPEEAQAWLDSL